MRTTCQFMSPSTREFWDRFAIRLKNKNSPSVYFGDINQCMEIAEKDLLEFRQADADKYYQYLLEIVLDRPNHCLYAYIIQNAPSFSCCFSLFD